MKITKISDLTGDVHTREIPIDEEQYRFYVADRRIGGVQALFPHLSVDDQEFLISGITPEEWDKYIGEEEEEDINDEYTGYGDIPPNAGSSS